MTMRTSQSIACECGHTGELRCSENDAPFSSMYESYSLIGFEGDGVTFTSWPQMQRAGPILAYLDPKCPSCGARGKISYVKQGGTSS